MRMKHREYIFLGILSTSCLLFLFGNSIIPTTNAQGSNSNSTFDLKLDNKSYPITYNMSGGKIDKMTAMKENSTLVIDLVTNDNGNLTLELPRNIMDSKNPQNEDEDYVIFADGLQIGADQITTNDQVRTLSIDFDNGVEQIEIAGTRIVPEFGPLSAILLAVSVIGVLAVTSKLGKFRGLRNS
ncbi:hypothetical protein BH18THE2_BH18THE2_16460 [soil metagenome]